MSAILAYTMLLSAVSGLYFATLCNSGLLCICIATVRSSCIYCVTVHNLKNHLINNHTMENITFLSQICLQISCFCRCRHAENNTSRANLAGKNVCLRKTCIFSTAQHIHSHMNMYTVQNICTV
jgi:hypothetical protein